MAERLNLIKTDIGPDETRTLGKWARDMAGTGDSNATRTEDAVNGLVDMVENIEKSQGPPGLQGEQGPKGDKGDTGPQGVMGPAGKDGNTPYIGPGGNWWIGETDTGGPASVPGPQGSPGVGVPAGGPPGQVLAKKSGADYDTEWVEQAGGIDSGGAATIHVEGTVTALPDEAAGVENVGTPNAARLLFTIPQGKPGKDGASITNAFIDERGHLMIEAGTENRLPWVSGIFQERSLAANTFAPVTAKAEKGNLELVDGNKILIPETGSYILATSSARSSGAGVKATCISRNNVLTVLDDAGYRGLKVYVEYTSAQIIPGAAYAGYFEEGEYLSVSYYAVNAQSTILYQGVSPRFILRRI